ncbi:MAG: DNA polymerase II large subunit, partial [Candidatus Diapherotrites archaeon]
MTGTTAETWKFSLPSTPRIQSYMERIGKRTREQFELAQTCKEKGLDVNSKVESVPVSDVASRAERLTGPPGIADAYRAAFLHNKENRMKAIVQIFEEILDQKWCQIPDRQKRIELAIKACLVIETEGVVVSPIDGLPKIQIVKNPDGSEYVDVCYASPIRAAGGRATVLPLILADFARKKMGLDRYKPMEEEVERYVEEINLYQRESATRQVQLTDDEVRIIVRNCPTRINGLPSEKSEVSTYRNLPRFESNRVSGAMALVLTEGVALKADWTIKTAKSMGLDWSWLEKIIKVEKKAEKVVSLKPNYKYLDRLAAGRPLLAYPMAYGGFRVRYGKSRNMGLM